MTDPVVLYTPGMSGMRRFDRRMVDELRRHGLTVRGHDWTEHWWPPRNLRDRDQHDRATTRLIEMIHAERESRPREPIALLAHSTGCLIVLQALARLSEPIGTALLMAAAIRPDYNLTPALPGCRRMIHIRSRLDQWFCGLGTTVFGTADGRHGPAASSVGFRGPGSDDPRFTQHSFRFAWLLDGHYGGHVGCLNRRFARRRILPLLRGDANPQGPLPRKRDNVAKGEG